MEKWKTTPGDIPVDDSECWIRLNYWFGQPFKAVWSDIASGWISVANGLFYPVWSVSRWKYV